MAGEYFYRLVAQVTDGSQVVFGPVSANRDESIPISGLTLKSPNPTPGGIQVQYAVARAGQVRLELLDVSGRVVATLADRAQEPGHYEAAWEGVGPRGHLPPGLYFVRFTGAGSDDGDEARGCTVDVAARLPAPTLGASWSASSRTRRAGRLYVRGDLARRHPRGGRNVQVCRSAPSTRPPMPLLRTLRQTWRPRHRSPLQNAPYRPLPVLRVSGLPGPLAGVFNRPGPCGWFQATALR